eukprot:4339632-Prymnesium_polylepis.1
MYKKNDRTDPRNYPPITLLNGDYKILMRILAIRMNEAARQFATEPGAKRLHTRLVSPREHHADEAYTGYVEHEDEEAS